MSQLATPFFEIDASGYKSSSQSVTQLFHAPSSEERQHFAAANTESLSELKRKSKRLNHLLEVMPAGVIVLDHRGVIKQANQLAVDLLGEPLEQELWREIITRSFKPQADDGHEVSLRDGRKVKLSMTPLVEEKGQLIVLTDMTETRRLQSRISHLQRLSSLGKMVASLAHQVRTPLSSALLYASNLSSLPLENEQAYRFANKITDRLKDLENQVNDMLLFAKSGEQQIIAPMLVSEWLVQSMATIDAQASSKNVQIKLLNDIPHHYVMGNQTALNGALANLLGNAIEVSAAGDTVWLSVVCEKHKQDNILCLSVIDQGCGIEESKVEQLFEPFYTTKTQGTGLGLAVVKSVINSHQGQVIVSNNQDGPGACFTLRLPIAHSQGMPGNQLSETGA